METPRPRNYIEQKYQEIRSLLPPISTLLLLFSTEIMGPVLPLSTGRPNTYLSIHLSLDGCRTWKFELPIRFRFDFGERRSFISVRVHMRDDTCTTWPLFVASNWDWIYMVSSFLFQMETPRARVLVIHGRGAAAASSPRTADTHPHTWPNQPTPCTYPTTPW